MVINIYHMNQISNKYCIVIFISKSIIIKIFINFIIFSIIIENYKIIRKICFIKINIQNFDNILQNIIRFLLQHIYDIPLFLKYINKLIFIFFYIFLNYLLFYILFTYNYI